MKRISKTVRLPIVFRSLDVERVTKPQGMVLCPIRNEPVSIGTCGHCNEFLRIEFGASSESYVSCIARDFQQRRAAEDEQPHPVDAVLRVPMLSVSQDTSVAALVPYLDLQRPWDVIPVLDSDAKPVGLVRNDALRRMVAEQADLDCEMQRVMFTQFARIHPWQSVRDAAAVRSDGEYRGVVVVSGDGTFLGLVSELDLPNAA